MLLATFLLQNVYVHLQPRLRSD